MRGHNSSQLPLFHSLMIFVFALHNSPLIFRKINIQCVCKVFENTLKIIRKTTTFDKVLNLLIQDIIHKCSDGWITDLFDVNVFTCTDGTVDIRPSHCIDMRHQSDNGGLQRIRCIVGTSINTPSNNVLHVIVKGILVWRGGWPQISCDWLPFNLGSPQLCDKVQRTVETHMAFHRI